MSSMTPTLLVIVLLDISFTFIHKINAAEITVYTILKKLLILLWLLGQHAIAAHNNVLVDMLICFFSWRII